jgi:hypothetical protein
MRQALLLVVLGSVAACGRVGAGGLEAPVPPNNPWWSFACCSWCSRQAWCPDDYCSKALPAPPARPSCCLPNDYCSKAVPPIPARPACCLPNDYCKKPCPIRVGPCVEPWYTCGVPHGNLPQP